MANSEEKKPAPRKRGFLVALGVILLLLAAGQVVGDLCERFPPTDALTKLLHGDRIGARAVWRGVPASLTIRDWLFGAFLVTGTAWILIQRRSIAKFMKEMHTGVTLVILSTTAVALGVLVPQIDGFEDPQTRVAAEDTATWRDQYASFRFAEGYFFYHLLHPYGLGMPKGEIPEQALKGLETFGRRYGDDERKNREEMMHAAFSGPQVSDAIEQFCARHESLMRTAFKVCTFLDFNRTYKSNWFACLLTLLFTSVALSAFRDSIRRWMTLQKIGFFVAHVGIMVLLLGGLVSKLTVDRGILNLDLNDPAPHDTYQRLFNQSQEARMPFAVQLENFGRKDWKQVEVYFSDDKFAARVPQYTLWPDRTFDLDYPEDDLLRAHPRLRIHVKSLCDNVQVGEPFVREVFDPSKPGDVNPIAELELAAHDENGATHRERTHLSPKDPRIYLEPSLGYRLRVAYGAGIEQSPASLFPAPGEETLGTIEFSVDGKSQGQPEPVPFKLGQVFELPGGWKAKIDRVTANFGFDPNTQREIPDTRPLADQPPERPAIWVDITSPEGKTAKRFLLDGIDWREQGMQASQALSQVFARFDWDRWKAPGAPRYVVHWSATSKPVLIGEDGSQREVKLGESINFPKGAPAKILQLVQKAEFDANLKFLPRKVTADGFDESFYANDPVGAEIEVIRNPGTPEEQRDELTLATSDLYDTWRSPDGKLAVHFLVNDKMLPYEWRSVLAIVERDDEGKPYRVPLGPKKNREIRVNDYFRYRGYRFFQTNANAEFPTYSGIGVVWDPGIEIVLLGMYTIIAGTVLAFIVRPIVRSREKKAAL